MRIALHCGLPHKDFLYARLNHRQWRELVDHCQREPVGSLAQARMAAAVLMHMAAGHGIEMTAQQSLGVMGFSEPEIAPPPSNPAATDAIVNCAFAAMGGIGF